MITIEQIIITLIDKARGNKGILTIRSRFGHEFERPDSIKIKGKKKQVTPDLVIESSAGTDLYVVEQETTADIEKWRLLSLYALKLQGNLYIVVPHDNEAYISRKLEESKISARIVYFSE
jgi:hypothetical protein